jgi:PIN domain nuclease of toxin-antitoxin system
MRRLLLDTNTLNYILKGRRPVLDRYEQAVQADCTFLLSPVAHYELAHPSKQHCTGPIYACNGAHCP